MHTGRENKHSCHDELAVLKTDIVFEAKIRAVNIV